MITRRTFGLGLSASGLLLAGGRAWSASQMMLGSAELTTLSDGNLSLPESFLYGDLDRAEVDAILDTAAKKSLGLEPPCNITLLRTQDAVVLFDAGSGPAFMPSAGKLPIALDAAGVAPEEITHVVFTHGHPDHLWGVLDDFDEPVFVNAQHVMGGDEMRYWTDPETVQTIAPERQSFAAGAARRIEMLGAGMQTFADGEEIVAGVRAVLTPGHTPGHMSFEITSGGESVFLIGDAIGNAHMALARPAWLAPADQQPEQGAETRLALLNRLAEDGAMAVGFHMPGGGLGRITREAGAFGWSSD